MRVWIFSTFPSIGMHVWGHFWCQFHIFVRYMHISTATFTFYPLCNMLLWASALFYSLGSASCCLLSFALSWLPISRWPVVCCVQPSALLFCADAELCCPCQGRLRAYQLPAKLNEWNQGACQLHGAMWKCMIWQELQFTDCQWATNMSSTTCKSRARQWLSGSIWLRTM